MPFTTRGTLRWQDSCCTWLCSAAGSMPQSALPTLLIINRPLIARQAALKRTSLRNQQMSLHLVTNVHASTSTHTQLCRTGDENDKWAVSEQGLPHRSGVPVCRSATDQNGQQWLKMCANTHTYTHARRTNRAMETLTVQKKEHNKSTNAGTMQTVTAEQHLCCVGMVHWQTACTLHLQGEMNAQWEQTTPKCCSTSLPTFRCTT